MDNNFEILDQNQNNLEKFISQVENIIAWSSCLQYFSSTYGLSCMQNDFYHLVSLYNFFDVDCPKRALNKIEINTNINTDFVLGWCTFWTIESNCKVLFHILEKLDKCMKKVHALFILLPSTKSFIGKMCKYQEITGEIEMDDIAVISCYLKVKLYVKKLHHNQDFSFKKFRKTFLQVIDNIADYLLTATDFNKNYYFIVMLNHILLRFKINSKPIIIDIISLFSMNLCDLFEKYDLHKFKGNLTNDKTNFLNDFNMALLDLAYLKEERV